MKGELMDNVDWGNLLMGGAGLGGILWALYEKLARSRVDRANNDAVIAAAESQEAVYTMLTNRLETLEKEVQGLRGELAAERQHSRKLEIHIWKLEGVMRKANIEFPLFEEEP